MKLLPNLSEKAKDNLFLMRLVKAREIWKHSSELEKKNPRLKRTTHELEFLPAALEVMETPPSRTARMTLWGVILIFVFAVAWATIGKTDIVVVSQGKTVPYRGSKPIQSLERGLVKSLLVEEGQTVKKGDVLIELDTTVSEADRQGIAERLIPTLLDAARLKALLDNPKNPVEAFNPPRIADQKLVETQRQLMEAIAAEYKSRLSTFDNDIRRSEAEIRGIRSEIKKLEQTLPLIRERASGQMELSDKGLLPRNTALQTQQELINVRQSLTSQQARLEEVQASLSSANQARGQAESEFKRQKLAELREAQEKVASLRQDFKKAQNRFGDQKILAPEDGIVQQLAVTAVGTVVEPGKELLYIVPAGEVLEVEAMLLNKDWGDVEEGQEAQVKFEAFPFTKFGTIPAVVRNKSPSSINDEKLGPVYKIRASLERNTMLHEGKELPLSPGMAVTLETKTGERRIIEFILTPIIRGFKEAARER